jgi:plasmid stability protein
MNKKTISQLADEVILKLKIQARNRGISVQEYWRRNIQSILKRIE